MGKDSLKNRTPFGKYVYELRANRDETMRVMAERLGVNYPLLSACEIGNRNAPPEWADLIADTYNLSDKERESLRKSISDSHTHRSLNITHLSYDDKRLMSRISALLPKLDHKSREMLDFIFRTDDAKGQSGP